jgi:formate--tetrahydrofolate ligase
MSDETIAAAVTPRPIQDVAADLGLGPQDLIPCGRGIAKVDRAVLDRPRTREGAGRLVLVSAITPTSAGEGKTTTAIGLSQGLRRLGHSVCLTLREPSLGPYMGKKGGATGGGQSQVLPSQRINLHFTGDFHAITCAHNLLAALLDNHLHHGNELGIDLRRVTWPRVLDLNDRSLRQVVTGLGGTGNAFPRETSFEITAASEVMATFCLATDLDDLCERLGRVVVAFTRAGDPVRAADLGAQGVMRTLLDDAFHPNLVQTLEGGPALIHGGPFANIAHGCNSLLATRMALHVSDWVVTEAGFGFDLGAEKFFDIKCRVGGLEPAACVLVATVRALKMHGGVRRKRLGDPDVAAVGRGLANLDKHMENVQRFGQTPIVALNAFAEDTPPEVEAVRERCAELKVPFVVARHYAEGGAGAEDLAREVVRLADPGPVQPLYELEDSVFEKVRKVARTMYGARDVIMTRTAKSDVKDIERLGYAGLPICIAKTHSSLSDDPRRRGRPRDFEVTVRRVLINAGAGFLVVLTGDILRMPGLPRRPRALELCGAYLGREGVSSSREAETPPPTKQATPR